MNYRQSLENIEKLKNFVWPFYPDEKLFFNFSSHSEFALHSSLSIDEFHTKRVEKIGADLPFAFMYERNEQAFLTYCDCNIHLNFNLTFNLYVEDQCTRGFKPRPKIFIQLAFLKLIDRLKNM